MTCLGLSLANIIVASSCWIEFTCPNTLWSANGIAGTIKKRPSGLALR